jgi:hypothetical protein
MTTVGHSLLGAAIGTACMPEALKKPWAQAAFLAGFMVLANLPDIPVPGWGHDRYDVSHSIPIAVLAITAIAVAIRLSPLGRRWVGSVPVLLGGAAAWLSHMLLDSFYNHRMGLRVWWPLSDARLALPIPWLGHLWGPGLSGDHFLVVLGEVATFLPLVLLAIVWRRWRGGGRSEELGARS